REEEDELDEADERGARRRGRRAGSGGPRIRAGEGHVGHRRARESQGIAGGAPAAGHFQHSPGCDGSPYGLGIGQEPETAPSSPRVAIAKSQRSAAGAELAWARWQERQERRLVADGPAVELVAAEMSSNGTSGR